MTLEELKQAQTQLVMQRSAGKDQIEALERQLGQVTFAIQTIEQQAKAAEDAAAAEAEANSTEE